MIHSFASNIPTVLDPAIEDATTLALSVLSVATNPSQIRLAAKGCRLAHFDSDPPNRYGLAVGQGWFVMYTWVNNEAVEVCREKRE